VILIVWPLARDCMKELKGPWWCAALIFASGCSAGNHLTPQAQVQRGPGRTAASSHPAPPVAERASAQRGRDSGTRASSRAQSSSTEIDPVYAAVVHSIVPANATHDYFIGYEYRNPIVEGPEPNEFYVDPSPLFMQLIKDRAPRVHPLSAYHGNGKRFIFTGISKDSGRTRVLARVDGDFDPHGGWYIVEFKGGQWEVTGTEPTFFK
jgi:hypothetical protein